MKNLKRFVFECCKNAKTAFFKLAPLTLECALASFSKAKKEKEIHRKKTFNMKKIQIPFTASTDHGTGLGKAHSVDKTIKA